MTELDFAIEMALQLRDAGMQQDEAVLAVEVEFDLNSREVDMVIDSWDQ